jgi:hypothetical protein
VVERNPALITVSIALGEHLDQHEHREDGRGSMPASSSTLTRRSAGGQIDCQAIPARDLADGAALRCFVHVHTAPAESGIAKSAIAQ